MHPTGMQSCYTCLWFCSGGGQTPARQKPPPLGRHPSPRQTPPPKRPLQRKVRILLECILVLNICTCDLASGKGTIKGVISPVARFNTHLSSHWAMLSLENIFSLPSPGCNKVIFHVNFFVSICSEGAFTLNEIQPDFLLKNNRPVIQPVIV